LGRSGRDIGQELEEQLVDELILYLAPKLMGSDGRGLMGALGLTSMSDVIDLEIKDVRQVGVDIRIVAKPIIAKSIVTKPTVAKPIAANQ